MPQAGLQSQIYYLGLYRGREHRIFWLVYAAFIAACSFSPLSVPEYLICGHKATERQEIDWPVLQQNDEVKVILEVHQLLWPLTNGDQPRYTRFLSLLLLPSLAVRYRTVPVDQPELIQFSWCECRCLGRHHWTRQCPAHDEECTSNSFTAVHLNS